MTTTSDRLGIEKPTETDDFDVDELAENWQKVDDHPGVFICTSGSRPAWGAPHEGMLIYEQDRDLYWSWTGSVFERAWPKGHLGGTRRTADLSTTSTTPAVLVSRVATVPTGGRRIQITVSWGEIENDMGQSRLSISRDGVDIVSWHQQDAVGADGEGSGGSFTFFEAPGEGVYTYAFQFAATALGGTTWARASATSPISIDVLEV